MIVMDNAHAGITDVGNGVAAGQRAVSTPTCNAILSLLTI